MISSPTRGKRPASIVLDRAQGSERVFYLSGLLTVASALSLLILLLSTPVANAQPADEVPAEQACSDCSLPATTATTAQAPRLLRAPELSQRIPSQAGGHRQVMLEIYTSVPCGACPDADWARETVMENFPEDLIVVEHHYFWGALSIDMMAIAEAETLASDFGLFGLPSGMLNRKNTWTNRWQWTQKVNELRASETPIDVTFSSSYNPGNRQVSVLAKAKTHTSLQGDKRLNCLLLEDPVIGSGQGYDQANNFNDNPSHPAYQAGDPATNFHHRYVVFEHLGGIYGQAGVIPISPSAGATYSHTFTSTLPGTVDHNAVTIACYSSAYGPTADDREIFDATWAPLGGNSPEPPFFWDYLESGNELTEWSASVP